MKRRDFIKKAGVGAIAAGAVIAGAPAVHAQKMIEITMVATWGRDFPGLGTGAQRFAARLQDMTNGRMKVNYFAANERVKAFDSFDEVASGNAQIYHAADYYWKGKHPGWAYITGVPFGLTYTEMNAWIRYGGGQELWDELAAGFGIKGLMWQYRFTDGRMVPQGNQLSRRSEGAQNAYSRPGRGCHDQTRCFDRVHPRWPDL